jgi:hypothetical protein
MFKARYLVESDYEILCSWWNSPAWKRLGWVAPVRECLPENGMGGIMLETEDGIPVIAGFIYFTNSKMCHIEYIISNPEYRDKQGRKQAKDFIIDNLCYIAKQKGYLVAFTSLKNQSLLQNYLNNGFEIGSQNTIEIIKVL